MGTNLRIATGVCIYWLLASPVVVAQMPTPLKAEPPPPSRLGTVLTKRGYVEVPLTVSKTGWLDVNVEANGKAMRLILDTGANNTNLDRRSAADAKLEVKESKGTTAAVGGTLPTGRTKIGRFSVGG